KRAQDSIVQLRPYADKLRDILQNISSTLDSNVGGELTVQREVQKLLLVVLTSNRGLAGAFNSSIVKKTNSIIEEAKQKGIEVEVLTIGKKGFDFLKNTSKIYRNESHLWDDLKYESVAAISEEITEKFINAEFDEVRIVYNQFRKDRKSTRLNSSHVKISYAVFCLRKK